MGTKNSKMVWIERDEAAAGEGEQDLEWLLWRT